MKDWGGTAVIVYRSECAPFKIKGEKLIQCFYPLSLFLSYHLYFLAPQFAAVHFGFSVFANTMLTIAVLNIRAMRTCNVTEIVLVEGGSKVVLTHDSGELVVARIENFQFLNQGKTHKQHLRFKVKVEMTSRVSVIDFAR